MDEEVNDCGNEKNSVGIIIPDNYVLTENFEGSHLNLIPIQVNEGLETPPSISDLGKQLLKASEAGHIDEIKLLMHRGAPFTADWLGTSPLHFAAQNNHLEVCRILLRAGISKDARTKVERTPLHLAVYYGHVDIVKCLLSNNADINCKDMLWMTPLHWAAQLGNAEIAQILVECGSEIDAVSRFDLTATDLALQVCRHDIVEIINTTAKVDTTSGEENEITAYVSLKNVEDEAMSPIPLETIIEVDDIDSENSIDPERLHITQEELVEQDYFSRPENVMEESNVDGEGVEGDKLSASIRFLQQHGITMLPPDDTNILSSILESGRSVTLTEVGKQVLNSTKPEIITNSKVVPKLKNIPVKSKKVVHILPQDYVRVLNENDIFKHFNGKIIKTTTKPITKRIVMRKNKTFPVTLNQSPKLNNVVKVVAQENTGLSDVEILRRQLVESKRLVEDYKQKYLLKCAEAEKYKLLLLTQSKDGC